MKNEMEALQGGYFAEYVKNKGKFVYKQRTKNTLVSTGANWFLRDIFRKETTLLPNTFYLGLTSAAYTFDTATLAAINAGEPVGHGYARQAINRDTVDWTVSEVNGVMMAQSKVVTFTASSDWASTWLRMFICDQAAGTAGFVISLSGPAPAARTVLSGSGPSVSYQYFLRG